MDVDDIVIQRIVAVLGMCLWFVFPIGIFISVFKLEFEAMPPKEMPKTFEPYQLHPPYYEDPFAGVSIGIENELEEPKIDDVGHQNVSIRPGPDHTHTGV